MLQTTPNELLRIREDSFSSEYWFVWLKRCRYCYRIMTTVADRQTLRTIVVVTKGPDSALQPTSRLLSDLGHNVTDANSPDEAVQILQNNGADLLVVDLPTIDQKRRLFERIEALPQSARPNRIAIFADEPDDFSKSLSIQQSKPRVHLFMKPLHVHGLLNVLRSLEGRRLASA